MKIPKLTEAQKAQILGDEKPLGEFAGCPYPPNALKPLFLDVHGTDMKKVDVFQFYTLATVLRPIDGKLKEDMTLKDAFFVIYKAKDWLDGLVNDKMIPLIVSKANAKKALKSIDSVVQRYIKSTVDDASKLTFSEAHDITSSIRDFETVFAAELQTLATYFVTEKRNYSTQRLIESGEHEFPEPIRKRLSAQCITDIKNATKCIAFELGTASGIHSFRALESVALDYLNKLGVSIPRTDLFTYLDLLGKNGANPDAIEVCQQLRKLKRNPLAHPEDNYDVDEAIDAFQLAATAISALIKDRENRKLF